MTDSVFPTVSLPRWSARRRSHTDLAEDMLRWVGSTAMQVLARAFQFDPGRGSLGDRLRRLAELSAERWDFRLGGLERWESVAASLPADIEEIIRQASTALGLGGRAHPPAGHYEHALVLGAGPRSALLRAGHLAMLLSDGSCTVGTISGLGSMRASTADEQRIAAELGFGPCPTEYHSVAAGLGSALQHGREAATLRELIGPGDGWRVGEYRAAVPPQFVLAAPAGEARTRANTEDTLTFWAGQIGSLAPGQSILVVTTDLYVPFQHCDAVRILGLRYDCAVETVGFDNEHTHPSWLGRQNTSAQLLQEVRSAILSMGKLHSAIELA